MRCDARILTALRRIALRWNAERYHSKTTTAQRRCRSIQKIMCLHNYLVFKGRLDWCVVRVLRDWCSVGVVKHLLPYTWNTSWDTLWDTLPLPDITVLPKQDIAVSIRAWAVLQSLCSAYCACPVRSDKGYLIMGGDKSQGFFSEILHNVKTRL